MLASNAEKEEMEKEKRRRKKRGWARTAREVCKKRKSPMLHHLRGNNVNRFLIQGALFSGVKVQVSKFRFSLRAS
jgi:hypothetical protein